MNYTNNDIHERDILILYIGTQFRIKYRYIPSISYTRTGFILFILFNNIRIDVIFRKLSDHVYEIDYLKRYTIDEDDYFEERYKFNNFDAVINFFDDIINELMPPRIFL